MKLGYLGALLAACSVGCAAEQVIPAPQPAPDTGDYSSRSYFPRLSRDTSYRLDCLTDGRLRLGPHGEVSGDCYPPGRSPNLDRIIHNLQQPSVLDRGFIWGTPPWTTIIELEDTDGDRVNDRLIASYGPFVDDPHESRVAITFVNSGLDNDVEVAIIRGRTILMPIAPKSVQQMFTHLNALTLELAERTFYERGISTTLNRDIAAAVYSITE